MQDIPDTTVGAVSTLRIKRQAQEMMPFNIFQPTYEKIPKDESQTTSIPDSPTYPRPTPLFSRTGWLIGAVIITTTKLVIITVLAYQLILLRTPRKEHSCGTTVEEAKVRGCTFDPLTVSWLPTQCSREGYKQFHEFSLKNSLQYYRDNQSISEIIGPEALSERGGTIGYWTTTGEHLAHCAFIFLRLHAAMDRALRVDNTALNPLHTSHCVDYLLEAARSHADFDKVTTFGRIKIGSC